MKKILSIVVLSFIICNNAVTQMKHSISKDEFKGTTNHFIKTDSVEPNKPLSFPYKDTKSELGVGCKTNNYYWTYVAFNKVNLNDGEIGDGHYSHKLDIKVGESFHKLVAKQDFGSNVLFFDMWSGDRETMTNLMKLYDEIWIQFNHYQDGYRFYKYDTRGFSNLFDSKCENAK
ncbi:hypothetical protein OA248_00145 [Candidatus Pelagibacter sp.]|nr:hypothetical protein [Candidatus Pelagibacter sp.]